MIVEPSDKLGGPVVLQKLDPLLGELTHLIRLGVVQHRLIGFHGGGHVPFGFGDFCQTQMGSGDQNIIADLAESILIRGFGFAQLLHRRLAVAVQVVQPGGKQIVAAED